MAQLLQREPVVITGLGTVSAFGLDTNETLERMSNGESALTKIDPNLFHESTGVHVVGQIPEFTDEVVEEKTGISGRDLDWSHRAPRIVLVAAAQAMAMAGISNQNSVKLDEGLNNKRVGVSIGSGAGGAETFVEVERQLAEKGRPGNDTIFLTLPERIGTILSMGAIARGPLLTNTGACAASLQSIINGYKEIALGNADIMIVGGSEAQVNPLALAMFGKIRALDKTEDPKLASRPFDQDRNPGFVMAEGGGVFVLESLSSALGRQANILGVISGYGQTADASQGKSKETAPDLNGEMVEDAIVKALSTTNLEHARITVKAHATATGADAIEAAVIERVFRGTNLVSANSQKAALGHTVGGSGGLETAYALAAMNAGLVLPTAKLVTPIPETASLYLPTVAEQLNPNLLISCSYGFGGINFVLAIQKYNPKIHRSE